MKPPLFSCAPISRVLYPLQGDHHSSVALLAQAIELPTRTLLRLAASDADRATGSPYSALHPPAGYLARTVTRSGGGLLPHLFTLTPLLGRFFSVALLVWLEQPARIFSGRWPVGARTFLGLAAAVVWCIGYIGVGGRIGKLLRSCAAVFDFMG